jgi:flagellar transcriptional activator FlhC
MSNSPVKSKSLVNEAEEINLAIEMIKLGARLAMLEHHFSISRERLIKLYKELKGVSPPKGMFPFSADWFLTFNPTIHSSIFYNTYQFLLENTDAQPTQALVKAYKLYLQQIGHEDMGEEPVLSITRAWTMIRFVESKMLHLETCTCCSGKLIVNTYDLNKDFVCSLCNVPSRAGRTKKSKLKELSYKVVAMSA